jgi:4-amino-4-deoxy-L-arabinose transferase-like glycosyltransferase
VAQETGAPVEPTTRWKGIAKWFAAAALVCFALACALVAVNAFSSHYLIVFGAQTLSAASLGLGLLALTTGVIHLAVSRPDTRKSLAFVFLLSVVVFGAHLYVINSPPTYTAGTPLSGMAGTSFHDSQVSVSSVVSGPTLSVDATDTGKYAISSLTLTLGNTTLPAYGYTEPATPNDPLQPESASSLGFRDSVTGTWAIPSNGSMLLTVQYVYLSCYHVPDESDARGAFGCIMDETYYVPAAQTLLAGTQCASTVANCNLEHPFLSKAIMAAGIAIFGLNGFGWRIFNVVLGTLSLVLLFALVYLVSSNRKLACLASVLLALDILFFVHSSAALIDVPAVFFSLLGFIFYFWRASYRKVDNMLVSGAFFGLATLCKETSVFLLAAVLTYDVVSGGRNVRQSLQRSSRIVIAALLVCAGGLQVYNTLFTSASYPYFYQQVSYILSYGSGLKGGGWFDPTLHAFINPLNWLTFYTPVSYLVTTITVTSASASYQYVSVGYYGVANSVIVWTVFAWFPLAVYSVLKARKEVSPSRDERLALLLVIWFLWAYVPYVLLWLYGRVTYPFYLIPAIPALAGGAAYFTTRKWFSYKVMIVYVVAALVLFVIYFPVKDFLPIFIRVALRR